MTCRTRHVVFESGKDTAVRISVMIVCPRPLAAELAIAIVQVSQFVIGGIEVGSTGYD